MFVFDPDTVAFVTTIAAALQFLLGLAAACLVLAEAVYEENLSKISAYTKAFWLGIKFSSVRQITKNAITFVISSLAKTAFISFNKLPNKEFVLTVLSIGGFLSVFLRHDGLLVIFCLAILCISIDSWSRTSDFVINRSVALMRILDFAQSQENSEHDIPASETRNQVEKYLEEIKISIASIITVAIITGIITIVIYLSALLSILYISFHSVDLPTSLAIPASIILIPTYLFIGIMLAPVPGFLILKFFAKGTVQRIEQNLSFRDFSQMDQTFGPEGQFFDLFGMYIIFAIAFGVLLASPPITLLGISLGTVSSQMEFDAPLIQLFAVNTIFDALTFLTTMILVFIAASTNKLIIYPFLFLLDLIIAAILSVLSLYIGLIGTSAEVSLFESMRVLVGYSPSSNVIALTPHFWIMHTAFIPTLIYMVILTWAWAGNVFIECLARFVRVSVAASRNPLKITAGFLGMLVVLIGGFREFVL